MHCNVLKYALFCFVASLIAGTDLGMVLCLVAQRDLLVHKNLMRLRCVLPNLLAQF